VGDEDGGFISVGEDAPKHPILEAVSPNRGQCGMAGPKAQGGLEAMDGSVGILAYGSLIGNPGKEIKDATVEVVSGIKPPFKVEFARRSKKRSGAPTLVKRGRDVSARIFVMNLPLEEAAIRLISAPGGRATP
jgi:hypothetical protein